MGHIEILEIRKMDEIGLEKTSIKYQKEKDEKINDVVLNFGIHDNELVYKN
jgi:hypothetical protein